MLHDIAALAAAVLTAILTIKIGALTPSGAIATALLILCSGCFGGWYGLVFLLVAYYAIAVIDHIFKGKTASVFSDVNQKTGARDHIQVAANGLPALVCVVLFGITGKQAFLIAFSAALTEAFADSIASDVGVMSRKDPVSICRFRRIPRGISGGISALGTGASLLSCLCFGALYYGFFGDLGGAVTVAAGGFLGCILDSILGDLLQEKFLCPRCGHMTEKAQHCGVPTTYLSGVRNLNNCGVNMICNLFSAVLAIIFSVW